MRTTATAVLVALLVLSGCATQPTPKPIAAATAAPHDLLWYRTADEMKVSYLQVYGIAKAAVAQTASGLPPKSWAVIMDADETILDNSEWALRAVPGYSDKPQGKWDDWVREKVATKLPGAAEFIDRVHELGGLVVVVTNRNESVCDATRDRLHSLSLHADGVVCARDDSDTDKNARFQSVRDGTLKAHLPPLNVIAYVGDNIQDFPNRKQGVAGDDSLFGTTYFLLPNPTYGSWSHNVLK